MLDVFLNGGERPGEVRYLIFKMHPVASQTCQDPEGIAAVRSSTHAKYVLDFPFPSAMAWS
jgi:hypothetical protein